MLNINKTQKDSTLTLALQGRLDTVTSPELESVLSGTFVSQSQLDDYPTYSELDAKIGQYISCCRFVAAYRRRCNQSLQQLYSFMGILFDVR